MYTHRMNMAAPPLELWQFRLSMYPEKARWALDYKGLPHIRHSLLPGPHAPQMMLRFGQKAMPVLRHGGAVIKGSAAVLDYLERQFPEPSLYPREQSLRARALELQAWFDEIGAHVRRAYFHEFLSSTQYTADLFSTGYPEWARTIYRAAFPGVRAVMRKDMKITDKNVAESLRRTREAMDFIVNNRSSQAYLVGDTFSVADLTAAVVLHPVALPEEFPVSYLQPYPPGVQTWLARWQNHPATTWVREMYRRHRGSSHEITAQASGRLN